MKKILVILFVSIATITGIQADESSEYTIFSKLNNEPALVSIIRELKVNQSQENDLRYITSSTDRKMKYALKKDNLIAADKVVLYNLSNLKLVLDDSQYKLYLKLINEAVSNENIKMIADNSL